MARAIQVFRFAKGELVYDQEEPGADCWVLEAGEVQAAVQVFGVRDAGVYEWRETRKYSAKQAHSCYFGEKGLLRASPRQARMTCRTEVTALRIAPETYVTCIRMREYKDALVRGVQLFSMMTDEQVGPGRGPKP